MLVVCRAFFVCVCACVLQWCMLASAPAELSPLASLDGTSSSSIERMKVFARWSTISTLASCRAQQGSADGSNCSLGELCLRALFGPSLQ